MTDVQNLLLLVMFVVALVSAFAAEARARKLTRDNAQLLNTLANVNESAIHWLDKSERLEERAIMWGDLALRQGKIITKLRPIRAADGRFVKRGKP